MRLTPDRQSRRGHLWAREAWSGSSDPTTRAGFEAIVRFHVHGKGTKLFGDGFAMWYTAERMREGDVFGAKDRFKGLGVFFDTYSNVNQGGHGQYVSVMLGDSVTSYDHTQVEAAVGGGDFFPFSFFFSVSSNIIITPTRQDGGEAKLAGCSYNFRGVEDMSARIVYRDNLLRVYLASSPPEVCV